MNHAKRARLQDISIQRGATLLTAIKQMDARGVKLLIVLDGDRFMSLLSIGDIQRALISNWSLATPVAKCLRKQIKVAACGDAFETIKEQMFHHRTECMPVLDRFNNLVDVHFWDEVFGPQELDAERLDLPVVIMAGGKGTRLKPLTSVLPKALIPIGEKTISEWIIERFEKIGIKHFYMIVNHRSDWIKYYFDHLETKSFTIEFIDEHHPMGTAGGLTLLSGRITQTLFLSNCDILVEEDYRNVYRYHRANKNTITVVAVLQHIKIPYGTIESGEDGLLTSLEEKPELTFKVNSGMYLLEPAALARIAQDKPTDMTDIITAIRRDGARVGVFPIRGSSWLDIGEWTGYQRAIADCQDRPEKWGIPK